MAQTYKTSRYELTDEQKQTAARVAEKYFGSSQSTAKTQSNQYTRSRYELTDEQKQIARDAAQKVEERNSRRNQFSYLDKDVIAKVQQDFKDDWYYWMDDPDDVQRQISGLRPKYWDDKYDLDDPWEQYLYENNLPTSSNFNKLYDKYYDELAEEAEKEAEKRRQEEEKLRAYQAQLDPFKEELYSMWDANPDAPREDAVVQLLLGGKYDLVADTFNADDEAPEGLELIGYKQKPNSIAYYQLLDEYTARNSPDLPVIPQLVDGVGESIDDEAFWDMFVGNTSSGNAKSKAGSRTFKDPLVGSLRAPIELSESEILRKASIGRLGEIGVQEELPDAKAYDERIASLEAYKEEVESQRKAELGDNERTSQADMQSLLTGTGTMYGARSRNVAPDNKHILQNTYDEVISGIDDLIQQAERDRDRAIRDAEYAEFAASPEFEAYAKKGAENKRTTEAEYINGTEEERRIIEARSFAHGRESSLVKYAHMTADEINIYNALYAKDGKNAAKQYLEDIDRDLNARNAAVQEERIAKTVDMSPTLAAMASVGSTMMSAAEGVGAAYAGLQHMSGNEIDPNSPWFDASRIKNAIRQNVSDNIKEDVGGAQGEALSFLYGTGMSISDFAFTMFITGGMGGAKSAMSKAASQAIMGSASMSNGILDALDRGATQDEAMMVGTASAIIEMLFEKFSIDSFVKITNPTTRGALMKNMLKQSGIEASEEFLTAVGNTLADEVIMGELSNRNITIDTYMANGLTREEAEKQANTDIAIQIGLSAVGGMLSGATIGGFGTATNRFNINTQNKHTLKELFGSDVPARVLGEYNRAANSAMVASAEAQEEFRQDIEDLGLSAEDAKTVGDIYTALASLPESWATDEAKTVIDRAQKIVSDAADEIRQRDADWNARTTKTLNRLNTLYNDISTAQQAMQAAKGNGDATAYAKAVQQFGKAINSYQAAAENAQAELDAAKLKKDTANDKSRGKARDAAAEVQAQMPEEIESLGQKALDTAAQTGGMQAADDVIEPADETEQASLQNNAVATAQERTMTDELINPASAESNAVQGGSGTLRQDGNQSKLDSREYDINTLSEITTVKAADANSNGGNTDGGQGKVRTQVSGSVGSETGDRPKDAGAQRAGAETDRGTGAGARAGGEVRGDVPGYSQKGVGVWDGSARGGLDKAQNAWRAKLGQDGYGGDTGQIELREATPDERTAEYIGRLKEVTGRDFFLYDADGDAPNGFTTDGKAYVKSRGDSLILFHGAHEAFHMDSALIAAAETVFDTLSDDDVQSMMDARRAMLERQFGEDYSENITEDELLEEFGANLYGAFIQDSCSGERVSESLGVSDAVYAKFADKFAETIQASALEEQQAEEIATRLETLGDGEVKFGTQDVETEGGDARGIESLTGGKITSYPERQIENWKDSKKIVIYESQEQYARFIDDAVSHKNSGEKMYFGSISPKFASVIISTTGLDLEGFNCAIQAYEVEKILKSHGDATMEGKHGQRGITKDDLLGIPRMMAGADTIRLSPELYNGKPAIMFKQTGDEWTEIIAIVSDKHLDLRVQTMYGGQKKSLAPPTDVKSPVFTSETPRSTALTGSISEGTPGVKGSEKYSSQQIEPGKSKTRIMAVQRLRKATELFEQGVSVTEYFESAGNEYDERTGKMLRGLYLKNGQGQGGALSETELSNVTENAPFWKQIGRLRLSVSSPVRVFENLGSWRKTGTQRGRAENYLEGEKLKKTYFEPVMDAAQQKAEWMKREDEPVRKAFGKGGIRESILAQMMAEGIIDRTTAGGALADSRHMIVPVGDGAFVFGKDGRLQLIADGHEIVRFDGRNAIKKQLDWWKKSKALREKGGTDTELRELEMNVKGGKPLRYDGTVSLERSNSTLTLKDGDGNILAQVTSGKAPDVEIAGSTADALMDFYDRVLDTENRILVENGYRPIPKRKNYSPHIGPQERGVNGFIAMLHGDAEALPAAISGITSTFSPGKPWASFALKRMGEYTEYDAIRGFNGYLKSAGDLIFYTPEIQRLRQLEKHLRETSSGNTNSGLVAWLHQYANQIANKKLDLDRGMEDMMGRGLYTISDALTRSFSRSAVTGSLTSAGSNLISFFSSLPNLKAGKVLPAIGQTLKNASVGKGCKDGFEQKIPFLTSRLNSYQPIFTDAKSKKLSKGLELAGLAFAATDRFSVETVARAKYAELMEKGFTEEEAIRLTDDLCIKLFGDKGKGMAPTIFGSKLLKPFTQFQLEVLNQHSHFRDIRRLSFGEQLDKVLKENNGVIDGVDWAKYEDTLKASYGKEWARYAGYLISMSLWGAISRALYNRDQTINPAGIAHDAIEDYQEGGLKQAATGVMSSVADQTAFASMVTGGGRIPIAGGVNDAIDSARTMLDPDTPWQEKAAELFDAGTTFFPGGGQIRKTAKGIKAIAQGGYYSNDGKRLYYPIDDTLEKVRAVAFGPSAAAPDNEESLIESLVFGTSNDYSWEALSGNKLETYEALVKLGSDEDNIYDLLMNFDGSTNASKGFSIARYDLDQEEVDMLAEMLGLSYDSEKDGTIKDWAIDNMHTYLEKKQKEVEDGELTQQEYDEKKSVYDDYLAMFVE